MGYDQKIYLVALICALYIKPSSGFQFNDDNTDIGELEYIPDETDTVGDDIQKRFSKFVRIGRGLSSFVRIGRNNPSEEVDLYHTEDLSEGKNDFIIDPGNSAFSGYQPEEIATPFKRLSSFVRIGRKYGDNLYDQGTSFTKRGGAFIRLGKFPTSAFIRDREEVPGYTQEPYYRRTGRIGHSSFIRIGKRDTTDALKLLEEHDEKQSKIQAENGYISNNKDGENNTIDMNDVNELMRYIEMERHNNGLLTKELTDYPANVDERRYLRLGREPDSEQVDKRLSNFVRIGKSYDPDNLTPYDWDGGEEKRLSNFVRIGKRDEDMNKRLSNFVRIGKNLETPLDENKRFSSFVRIGKSSPADKRFSSFVRIGKQSDAFNPYVDKRFSSFVRIGKNYSPFAENEKRYSSFVRIGKNGDTENDSGPEKRMSSFVRIGRDYLKLKDHLNKRLSSFIRVGKSNPNENNQDKRFSSFVRIGKSSEEHSGNLEEKGDSNNNENLVTHPYNLEKRALSRFVRIGKNISKNEDKLIEDSKN